MATQDNIARPGRLTGAKRASAETASSHRTFLDLIHKGEIRHLRIGKALYVERRDVERWIEQRKVVTA